MLWLLFYVFAALCAIMAVAGVCGAISLALDNVVETIRLRRAAKEALRQKPPPVSKYAVLNPAELKARR